ncbi:hypothetical protein SLEP1_g35301 [Rubroshorea leprosula]|uniref:Ankyrin repeat protein n=1 Tax=Rubroshorea leprosula TaxID=152421 RepID=A0AAV5KNA2_9ROSI|nr:hypothetical protein SLEP1_g35301 [Rubroshorea leprosula]
MERLQSLIVQNAIDEGDVNAVMDFYKRNSEADNLVLWTGLPILHHATIVGKSNIVKALVESMPALQVQQKDVYLGTALSYAAWSGNTELAKYLVNKDSTLLSMKDLSQEIPVVAACRAGQKEVTNFLYSETSFEILSCENGKQGSQLLSRCFSSQRFDIMLDVLHRGGQSLIDENWKDLLDGFVRTPTAFSSGRGLTFWQRWIYECLKVHISSDFADVTINQKGKKFEEMPLSGRLWRLASFLLPFLGIKRIHALKWSHGFARASLRLIFQRLTKLHLRKLDTIALLKAITRAIENGIYDFLVEMVETNADLLLTPMLLTPIPAADDETTHGNFRCENFLMNAIAFRQEKIACFLIGLPLGKLFINLRDPQKNTILHTAGELASDSQLSRISGAALQMQREIQWWKVHNENQ